MKALVRGMPWPPTWVQPSPCRNFVRPNAVAIPPAQWRRTLPRHPLRPMRIRPDRHWIPHSAPNSPEFASVKIIQRPHPTLPCRLLTLERAFQILLAEIHIEHPPVHDLCWRQSPTSPLPPLRPITHQSPLVAAQGDEEVGTLASQGIFQSTECTRALTIVRPDPILVRFEVWQEFLALVPDLPLRIPLNKG